MDQQQKQTILDLPKVIAVGVSSPAATLLTSRFGVAGTLLGLALSAVILTVLADALKVYLARASAKAAKVPGAVAKLPGGLRHRTRRSQHNVRGRLRTAFAAAFARFSSLPSARARWRPILIGSIAAAGISFLVGLSIVTGVELGVGKSLSCWVWADCPAEASTGDGRTPTAGTMPSILGGGQGASSVAPEAQAPEVQAPVPDTPGGDAVTPAQPEDGIPGADQGDQPDAVQPGQRWSPSVTPEEAGEEQPETPSPPDSEDQQSGSSGGSEGDQQQGSSGGSEGDQQQEDQEDQPPSGSDQQTQEPVVP